MNISRATIATTMILFLSGIGADGCGFFWPSTGPSGSEVVPPPSCGTHQGQGGGYGGGPGAGGGDVGVSVADVGAGVGPGGGDPGSSPQDEPCSGTLSMFRPSNFKFVTIVTDDGTDVAGGWQEAVTVLAFADGLTTVVGCPVHIGMPLRAAAWGKIDAVTAAGFSTDVANKAAANVWPTTNPPGVFCIGFKKEMGIQFEKLFPKLGAMMMP